MTLRRNALLRGGIGAAISVVAIWLVLRSVDVGQTVEILRAADLGWIVLVAGFVVVDLLTRALRWQRLVAPIGHVGFLPMLAYLLIGYLAFKSTFLPRPIGVLMGITGLGWLTFFIPPIAAYLLPYNAILAGLVGEGAMILWLLVMGVNSQRWNEQVSKASEPDQSMLERAAV